MRSLWYILTHSPTNLDDCLHFANTRPIEGASLRLQHHELPREQGILVRLLAIFTVKYPEKSYAVQELCGGYLDTDSEESKHTEFACANAKLKKFTQKFVDQGVVISNSAEEFTYRPLAEHKLLVRKNPYERFADTEFVLRDQLAIDRTILANERTFLAYCRTSLALILTGAGCIKFFHSHFIVVVGWGLIALGLIVAVAGAWRSSVMAHAIGTVGGKVRVASPEGADIPSGTQPEEPPDSE